MSGDATAGFIAGIVLALLVIGLFIGLYGLIIWATIQVAVGKGRSRLAWGIWAAFFPLLTLLIAAVLPPSSVGERERGS